MELTQVSGHLVTLSPWVKRRESEANDSHSACDEVEMSGVLPRPPLYTFTARTGTVFHFFNLSKNLGYAACLVLIERIDLFQITGLLDYLGSPHVMQTTRLALCE